MIGSRPLSFRGAPAWRRVTAALALALCAAPARSQAPSEGVFTGTPAALLVAPGTSVDGAPTLSTRVWSKPAGFVPPKPLTGPAAALEPDFSAAALWGDGMPPPDIQINAFSLGLDDVMASVPSGGVSHVAVPPGAWGALLFSVSRGSAGVAGGLIEAEAGLPGGAGADLFSLVLPGSTIAALGCYPSDRPQRGLDAGEMGLGGPSGAGEISAVDWFAPLYATGDPLRAVLPDAPRVFFSIAHDDVFASPGPSLVPSAWWAGKPPSSATVLMTRWQPGGQSWSTPEPFLQYSDLGLDEHDDIDALGVDFDDELMLFSIVGGGATPLSSQLQIAAWSGGSFSGTGLSVSTGDYVSSDGAGGTESVAVRAGLAAGDEVDGTCTIDPGEQGSATDRAIGTPFSALTPFKTIPAALFRDEDSAGPTLTLTASNIPTAPTTSFLQVWGGAPLGGGGYILFPAPFYSEPLTGAVSDSTRSLSISDPSLAVLAGVDIELFWVIRPGGVTKVSARLRIEI